MVLAIIMAILQLVASVLWAVGCFTLAKDINEVVTSGGTGGPNGMFEVFMQIGVLGLLQSIGALRGLYAVVGESVQSAFNTRYFTLWKNSSGDVVAAEEDYSTRFIGCLMVLVVGGFVVVACSALISPIMFMVNVSSALILLTGGKERLSSIVGIVLSVILCLGCIGGSIYGWRYISTRVSVLQERRKAARAEREKQYEEQRAEEARKMEAKRAEEQRIRAEQRAERDRQNAVRRAEREQKNAARRAAREQQQAERRAAQAFQKARGNNGGFSRAVPMSSSDQQMRSFSAAPVGNCRNCRGAGQVKVFQKCPVCNGRRRLPNPAAAASGFNAFGQGRNRRSRASNVPKEVKCPSCNGNGRIQTVAPCGKCNGTGKMAR